MNRSEKPLLGITMGDPAGIGSEVIVKAYPTIRKHADIVVIGDASVMQAAAEASDLALSVTAIDTLSDFGIGSDSIQVLDIDNVQEIEYGVVRREYGQASLEFIERAIDLAIAEEIDAIITAPINKQATRLAGSEHAGHTGLLADRTDTENYSMMLIEGDLRVTHVSTHVPLRVACDLVTEENVLATIEVTEEGLQLLGIESPTIAVAGLNPHASDGGLLGDEEAEEIEPAIERARSQGIDAVGPVSPDTVYVKAASGTFDCVVSMYHDEGHIPVKMRGFTQGDAISGVNMTVGLPICRTSVDHGTAFDIAGDGIASESSMIDAVRVATRVVQQQD